ncbi:general substrate transporter [Xylogone sp. PMI_703]|nr:general substrate transporter [Xylogone sp. PMI_703]
MNTAIESKKTDEPKVLQQELIADVEEATRKEHELTLFQAIKLYPKAVAWSAIISASTIMDGYDFHVLGSLFAQPAFQKAFGDLQPNGTYQISAPWQSGLNNGASVGALVGLFLAGYFTDKFGFRKTIMLALFFIVCFIFIQFFATSLIMYEFGQISVSIPVAVFQTIASVYAVEVAPTSLRTFLTSYVNQMWVIGQILSTCVIRGVLNMEAPWSYRIPFAVQWFWPLPIFVAVIFAPESPWWLVRHNRLEEAKVSLKRLASRDEASTSNIEKTVALMVLTTEYERQINSSTSYVACFKGTDLRRTTIVIFLFCIQIIGGTTLRSYATYFFEQAGLPADQSFNMSIITYVVSFVGTIVAWFLMPYIGRRTLLLWGLYINTAIYFVIGALGVPHTKSSLSWAIASLLIINGFVCYVCIIPVIFVLSPEIPSTLLRSKSVPVGRFVYSAINIAASILVSYQLNPSAWAWGAKSGFFWGVAAVFGVLITYFILPETRDRTITEIDLLFEKRVSARKFAETQVNVADVAAQGVIRS